MASDDRPPMGKLRIMSVPAPNGVPEPPPFEKQRFRSLDELEPVARQISRDPSLMERFRGVMGSDNEDRAREMVEEVRRIAQTIDPSISYAEGASVTLALMQIVRDQDQV
jgi:hypothetical protein